MKVKRCDRCKRIYEMTEHGDVYIESKLIANVLTLVISEDENGKTIKNEERIKQKYDLCDECARTVEYWIMFGTLPEKPVATARAAR